MSGEWADLFLCRVPCVAGRIRMRWRTGAGDQVAGITVVGESLIHDWRMVAAGPADSWDKRPFFIGAHVRLSGL